MNKTDRLPMNRLIQHSAIVLSALCLVAFSPLIPGTAAAEQPDVAQRHYDRGAGLLKKGDVVGASEAAKKAIELNPSSSPICIYAMIYVSAE